MMGNMAAQIYRDSKAADDAQRVFLQEVQERKAQARSARKKRNGSKSTRVTLPSDNLTQKEWESRNGDVQTSMAPMRYTELLCKTADCQSRWLRWIRLTFNATTPMITEMLGAYPAEVRGMIASLKREGFDLGRMESPTPSIKHMEEWNQWLRKHHWDQGIVDIEEIRRSMSVARKHRAERTKEENMAYKRNPSTAGSAAPADESLSKAETTSKTSKKDPNSFVVPVTLKPDLEMDTTGSVESKSHTSVFTRTIEPGEDPENIMNWIFSGLRFMNDRKLTISIVSVETE